MFKPYFDPVKKEYLYITTVQQSILMGYSKYIIPEGFIFDGASIPRIAWSLLGVTPYEPDIILASLVHDWFYTTHEIKREFADKVFHDVCIQNGISKTKAVLMYNCLHMFGVMSWNNTQWDIDNFKQACMKEGDINYHYYSNILSLMEKEFIDTELKINKEEKRDK